ncbi:MAG: succinyltransferase involved in succinoglycan biosynthesis [Bacteroidetes bacterium]|nr:succinyltransferase involved in succinoglycan biosynthesis [Bacteroidota bacterium]
MRDSKLIEKQQSDTINAIRFPLIILVLFIHMIGFEAKPIKLSLNVNDIYVFIAEMISHSLGAIAVPSFFLFSGYFFFKKMKKWDFRFYGRQLKNRYRTLLLPYVIWNILMILAILVKDYAFLKIGFGGGGEIEMLKLTDWYQLLWGMPINYPLWYLRDLICMSAIAPLFYYYFKFLQSVGVIILLVLYFSLWESNVAGISTTALTFFGLGSYFALSGQNLLKITMRIEKPAYVFTFVFLFLSTFFNGTFYHPYFVRILVLFGIISGLNLTRILIRNQRMKDLLIKLSPTVFFVYAIHEIYIINWLKGAVTHSPLGQSSWTMLLGYFIIPFICLGICLGLYKLFRLVCPQVLSTCVGNRTIN